MLGTSNVVNMPTVDQNKTTKHYDPLVIADNLLIEDYGMVVVVGTYSRNKVSLTVESSN